VTLKNYFLNHFGKQEKIALIVAFLGTYFLFPFFFTCPMPASTWDDLDPSWRMTLNKINYENLTWGKDFIFTYGPLSYLSTRMSWGINKYQFIFYDLFFAFNFFWIFYKTYLKSINKCFGMLLIIIVAGFLPIYFGSGNALVLNAFLLYWIRESLEENKPFYYLMQIAVLALVFFIKFNTGLISFIFFSAGLAYKLIFTNEKKIVNIAWLLTPFLLLFILSRILHVALWPYIEGGLNLVSGYNEIMYLNEHHISETVFFMIVAVFTLILMLQHFFMQKENLPKNLATCFVFGSSFYVLYKQGFVRADIEHISQFYDYLPLLILSIRDFHSNKIRKSSMALIVLILGISVSFGNTGKALIFSVKAKFLKGAYIAGFKNYSPALPISIFDKSGQLPLPIRRKIANDPVDIYPWNGHLLIQNLLNFTQRPVFQSYTAYTPYLENLNFDFYNSAKAPEYVFYQYNSIDNRYPLLDESKLNMLILKNYICTDTFTFCGNKMLLLKKTNTIKTHLKWVREYETNFNEWLIPGDSMYYEVSVSNTWRGKLVSFFYHSPEITLTIKTADGKIHRYKTSKKLLETGVFSSRFYINTNDILRALKKGRLRAEDKILGYGFEVSSPGFFDNAIKIAEYKIQ
jgi:hypothetical protein